MIKKIILGLILFLSLTSSPVWAQQTAAPVPTGQTGGNIGTSLESGINVFNPTVNLQQATGNIALESYLTKLISDVMNVGTRKIVGNGLGTAGASVGAPQVDNGATGIFAYMIQGMYNTKPASTGDYINYLANNAGFPNPIKPVYAAPGIGFTSLTPVMELWKIVRNIAYLVFSVIFVVVGLMILLRVKIDPKTVITVQNALPRIIWALILITFSYPIAGFLIDMMYVLIGVILSLAGTTGLLTDVSKFSTNLQNESIFGFVGAGNWWNITQTSFSAIQMIVDRLTGPLALGGATGTVIGALGGLIIAVAILYALVKTWLSLLGAYVNILVGVILSPLAMVAEAVPGVGGFSVWIRSMLANLLAFPLVIILLVFGQVIMEYGSKNAASVGSTTNFVPPLIGGNNMASMTALIGLGILLMIPKAVNMLQDWLKAPSFKSGMAWTESTGFGAGVATGPARERFYQEMYNRAVANPIGWTGAVARGIIGFGAERKLWGPPPRLPENAQPGPGTGPTH